MGIFIRRKKVFRGLLGELEQFLISKGITPSHLFKDANLLDYLACVPFNNLLYSFNLTRVKIDLSEEERQFVDFLLKYKRIRQKKINFLLDTPPDRLYYDSPTIGWRENPRYEEEVNQYRMRQLEYEHREEMLERQREELWKSPESEIFRHVEKEDKTALCSYCMGSGRQVAVGEKNAPELREVECSRCRGTGGTGYTPRVSPQQRQAAETFRAKLQDLEPPVFSNFPVKKKPVFLRLTYEGQIFIK